jgi:hypothetical protein
MAMDYFNPAEAFKAGYAATEEVSSDIQSKDILRQAYAGITPQEAQNPQAATTVFSKAAQMAGMAGNASLAHEFTKQASATSKLVSDQRASELKDTQDRLGLAAQYLKGAVDDAGLEQAINAAGLPMQAKMQAMAVLKSNAPFLQKQATLEAMGRTVAEDLQAQKLTLDALNKQSAIQNRAEDNLRADRKEAADVLKLKIDTGFFPDTPEGRAALNKEIAALSTPTTAAAKPGAPTTPAVPSTTPAPGTTAEDWAKANGIPVSPHGGTRDTQGQADQMAAWYKGGMKGPRPAEPGTSKHEKGNAIDVPAEGRTPENRAKLEAAGFKNTVKGEPWHFEREEPKAAPAPTEADKKAAVQVSLPTADNPTGAPPAAGEVKPISRKGAGKASAINERLAWGINEASLQAGADITNIAKLPVGSELGALAGMAGKSGAGFTSSLANATARKLTTNEQRVFQTYVAGFEANISRALGGGYAQSSTKQIMDQYKEQIAKEGDDPIVMAAFLARSKQELTLLNKAFKAHPGANAKEIEQNDAMLAELNKFVTWSVDDVTKALNATGKQSLAQAGQKITSTGKPSSAAAAEAEKAGF